MTIRPETTSSASTDFVKRMRLPLSDLSVMISLLWRRKKCCNIINALLRESVGIAVNGNDNNLIGLAHSTWPPE